MILTGLSLRVMDNPEDREIQPKSNKLRVYASSWLLMVYCGLAILTTGLAFSI